jgi:hypothetical protein
MRAIPVMAILAVIAGLGFVAGLTWANHLNAHMFDDGVTFGANMALREMDGCAETIDRNIVAWASSTC